MMHPYSPSSRWLAVPGIGFPQNVSGAPDVIDLATFRRRTTTGFTEGWKFPSEVVRRDDRDDPRPSSWLSFLAWR
jgi:hypothetical protein